MYWVETIEKTVDENKNVKIILVGNKSDLNDQREVSYDEGKKLADFKNIPFFETSAKDNKGINEIMRTITENILNDNKKNKNSPKDEITLEKENSENGNDGYCASC